MNIKVIKCDRRHTGYQHFDYIVQPKIDSLNFKKLMSLDRFMFFNELRNWCWQTWGPSCERSTYIRIAEHEQLVQELNKSWSWNSDHNDLRIYLATEKELNWLKLRWL